MIYLAGDNNLTDECVHALTQMKQVESLDDISVVAQFDPKGGRLRAHRYEIKPISKTRLLSDDYIEWGKNEKKFYHKDYKDYAAERRRQSGRADEEYLETNTGSPVTLFNFVTWCIENRKADCYMLVLSGHGGGTEKGYLLRDENPSDALTIWEMQVALDAIKDAHGVTIDVLGMDCCLMTMAEVSYQLRDRAKLLVGSEGYSPIAGWPLMQVLGRMRDVRTPIDETDPVRHREQEIRAVATGTVEEYVNYYLDYTIGGLSVEQACLDLRETDAVKSAIDELAKALRKELINEEFRKAIVYSHWEAQSFNGEQFVDLYDFCQLLQQHYPHNGIGDACQAVLKTEEAFVPRSCYSGPTYQYARGVSIYFPWAEIDRDYAAVRFSRVYSQGERVRDSPWMEFLKDYVVATRRLPRHPGRDKLFGSNEDPYSVRHAPGRHAPGRMLLPEILSMRNPPLSGGLSLCIWEMREEKTKSFGIMAETLTPVDVEDTSQVSQMSDEALE